MDSWRDIKMDPPPRDGRVIEVRPVNGGEAVEVYWDAEGDSWADENGVACEAGLGTIQVTGIWATLDGGWLQPNEVSHWRSTRSLPDDR